jgi:hypothetical protein
MLDIETLVEADESYRKLLIPELSAGTEAGVSSITSQEEIPTKSKSASGFR